MRAFSIGALALLLAGCATTGQPASSGAAPAGPALAGSKPDAEGAFVSTYYRADEMANMIAMSKEFGYRITAFHHAVEAYKIADILKDEGICSALWADWYGFKMESYDGIQENLPFVHAAGACAITHSDDADGIQRLNQETAKALASGRRLGVQIRDEEAWTWIAINRARALGIADKVGSLEPGKQADVVLWNGNPLSVYSRAEKVWVDGALLYDVHDPTRQPVSDFELGQPGAGDRK